MPPHLFSRKLTTAKPTICAQQPATAAPPASKKPSSVPFCTAAASAELENINFSKKLTELEYGVFYDCPKLTGFTVPDELDIEIFRYTFGSYDEEYPIEAKYKGTTWVYVYDEYGFVNTVQSAER